MNAALRIVDIITSDGNKKYEPAGRMAAAIIDFTQKNGGCLPQDLNACGFSADDVSKYWDMAQSLAEVEWKLMKDHGCRRRS